jgi:hypothetical protein
MSTQIRWRRGTTAQHSTFTGAEGEITVDTSKKVAVVHDGATVGGFPLVKASEPEFTGSITTDTAFNTTADNVVLRKDGVDIVRFGGDNSGQLAGFRNKIINGNFGVNQRGVSGTVTLAAGAYGHDRWKAGSSGCTYTFATSNNVTTITITAGSLMQVIEGLNLQSGTHILSWQGTAQGRIDSGAYGASGITGTAVGGTNQSIEFSTGTISKVQYEEGSIATPFEHRPIGLELALCQRYYVLLGPYAYPTTLTTVCVMASAAEGGTNYLAGMYTLPVSMRAVGTVTASSWGLEGHHASTPIISAGNTYVLFRYSGSDFRSSGGRLVATNAAISAEL